MGRSRFLLLSVVFLIVAVALPSCKKSAPGSTDVKIEPQLIMFGGWQSDNKGIYLAKNDTSNEGEKTYFSLTKPNSEPTIAADAPKMEIDFGKSLFQSGGNNTSRYATISTDKDEAGKITKAKVTIEYFKSNMGAPKTYDLDPVDHSLHGWSSDNVNVVMSREGKRVYVVDANGGGLTEIKLKNITSFNGVVLAPDKNSFYVFGGTESGGAALEHIDFNNVKFKPEKSRTVLNIPKAPTGKTTFRCILSSDQKLVAVFMHNHKEGGVDEFHADGESKLFVYDIASGQMNREYKLPNGDADLRNMLFVKGPWWGADNQAIAFDLRPSPDKKTFYSIDLQSGEITNWYTAVKATQ